jgi:phosphoribosylamine-glycine ligase
MRFVIATHYFAGLGFAMRLQDEGHEVVMAYTGIDDRRTQPRYALVGDGIVRKLPLTDVMRDREAWRDWYFVWDENHSPAENELLRREGFRVVLGGAYADRMEHDREACLEFVGQYGLQPPPSFPFTSATDALAFVEAHPETAYVYKPDVGENYETWLPQSDTAAEANLELRAHLRSLRSDVPFILQERKDGIETNVEVWFVDGEPRFAFMSLESKYKLTGDLGDLIGCAFDFVFTIPVDSRAVTESVGRLFPAYREMRYTGFGDANFVAARDGLWFFEKCERFGYNAHPNLFWTLNRDPLGTTLASLADRTFEPNFSPGFGASCSMYMDHPQSGKAILYPDEVARNLYFYDVYRDEGGALLTAGYYDNVLVANAFGYTIPTAWEAVYAVARAVKFPGRSFRTDGAGTDYPSSPLRRYEALQAMGYL